MKLIDAIERLYELDSEGTIYVARPWIPASEVLIVHESDEDDRIVERSDFKYFLEVFIAKDFLEDLKSSVDVELTSEEKCSRLIEYAINDA